MLPGFSKMSSNGCCLLIQVNTTYHKQHIVTTLNMQVCHFAYGYFNPTLYLEQSALKSFNSKRIRTHNDSKDLKVESFK